MAFQAAQGRCKRGFWAKSLAVGLVILLLLWDSRICDEKSGFCERVQGRILGVCNRSTREAIHDLSRKAESPKLMLFA